MDDNDIICHQCGALYWADCICEDEFYEEDPDIEFQRMIEDFDCTCGAYRIGDDWRIYQVADCCCGSSATGYPF